MTINCLEFRQIIGAEPGSRDKDVLRHRLECRACGEYARKLEAMDTNLQQALKVQVPEDLQSRIMLRTALRRENRMKWYAAAASVVLVVGMVIGVSLNALHSPQLGKDVIAHIHLEAEKLLLDQRISNGRLDMVLQRVGVRARQEVGEVTYAGLCPFRGKLVAHLIMQGETGPITLMLLPNEQVNAPTPIDEEGFHGVLLPWEGGSIAVVGMHDEPLEAVQARMVETFDYGI
ncbi:MAG: DUF3379 domain-containing protein [Gammaproteobacteria bacterium]|nr:DUF3379 domain-containing protein [Gammaproteobacteria bacterium]